MPLMAKVRVENSQRYIRISIAFAHLAMATSAASLFSATPGLAGQALNCPNHVRGAIFDDCLAEAKIVGENTEKSSTSDAPSRPFVISVDGESVAGGGTADAQRRNDVALEAVDIQVKFDGLDAKQILFVSAKRSDTDTSKTVKFHSYTNYDGFIKRSEIRIYNGKDTAGAKAVEQDPLAVLPVGSDGSVEWNPEGNRLSDLIYVLRAYDDQGHYDETTTQTFVDHFAKLPVDFRSNDETTDMTRVHNIPVYGGAVTVYGRNIPAGYGVSVLGDEVAVDQENKFLFQQILPSGDHDVSVKVFGGKSDDLQFVRQINIPQNDWFYVGLADLTVGHNFGRALESVNPGEFEKTYTKGRLAFYLKGKIKGKYLLTAAADTGEGKIGDLFKGFDKKDTNSLLSRLDPNDYYPIYGDDSTIMEDAPTSGKAYIRLERGNSHVMWGNFKTTISGTEFARNERALYGAHALFKSESATNFGESKTKLEAYAAQPGTVPQRDDFLGTYGSAYFLKNQDINTGTEQVVVERRDSLSGRIVSRVSLKEGVDYSIDYIQGVIILNSPLSQSAASSGSLTGGGTGVDELHLVVNYETTPTLGQQDGQTMGARGEQWLGEYVKVGGTVTSETVSSETNKKIEADLTLRLSDKTEIQFEVAQSQGKGIGQSLSTDGGLTFNNETVAGAAGIKANAYRAKAKADLGEISGGKLSGSADAYYEFREKDFSALESETTSDKQLFGANLALNVSDNVIIRMGAEGVDAGATSRNYRVKAETEAEIAENWTLVAGVTWSRFQEPGKQYRNGNRSDLGARLAYRVDEDTSVYVFGQKTLSKTGDRLNNDRVGFGGETQLNERFGVAGEVSYGNTGIGGSAAVTYKRDADNSSYFGYKLDPDRDTYTDPTTTFLGTDSGIFIAGANSKLNDWTSAFTETNADLFGRTRKLGQVYGLTFTPDKAWSTSLGVSFSSVHDPIASDFDRKAASLRVGYSTETLTASLNGEARFERSKDHTRDRDTYLLQSAINVKTSDNWRMLASVDAVISNSDQASILDGDYIKASIGATYRPIDNDKLNLLFRYTYLYDLPGTQQVNASGNLLGPAQRSHILSADVTYDINEWLTVGGKYGFRTGSISKTRAVQDFETSTVHLGILRADVSIVKNWDLLAEARVLYSAQSRQTDLGFLAAAYRHFGNNMKVGVGYNFGKFSDELSDLTHNDKGVFFNVIGKF